MLRNVRSAAFASQGMIVAIRKPDSSVVESSCVAIVGGFAIAGFVGLLDSPEAAAIVFLAWMAVATLVMAATRLESAICLLAFAFPLNQFFYKLTGTRFNTLGYLAALTLVIGLHNTRIRWTRTEIWAAVWAAWAFITVAWSAEPLNGLADATTLGVGLLILVLFHRGPRSEATVFRCLGFFVAGTIVMSAWLLRNYQPTAFVYREVDMDYVFSTIGAREEYSPVLYARDLGVAIVAALAWSDERRFPVWSRVLTVGIAVICSGLLLLTVNRGIVFALGAALIAWLICSRTVTKLVSRTTVLAALLFIAVFAAWRANPEILAIRWSSTAEYYEASNMRRLTAGRSLIWASTIEMFQQRPLLGSGLGSFQTEYVSTTGDVTRAAHSLYVTTIAETGLIGSVLLSGFLVSSALEALRNPAWRSTTIAWWTLMVVAIGASGLSSSQGFFMISGLTLFLSRREMLDLSGRRVHTSRGSSGDLRLKTR